ncbi:site-2 protease family protein [Streptacidiphilus sp. ASG 303]|uniref:site-2 protease family protein n=1 Tax=Streptacidiphilus sp. ASG 303 TaxID=2896847 RepID=UPI001E4A76A8|nr:site-2 protease family protein [Streptacidiphilus sp. ASG 303]MCD0483084.1 site-2 protease family protein [Streptacidiphilus sp. ASG 303]
MDGSIGIGRVFGIPLKVHWSVPLLLVVLGYGLGRQVLPAWVPGRTGAAYAAAGLVGALVLLGSLVLHEGAHAVVARRSGVKVEDMTLWALGGVTRMGQPQTPGTMLAVSGSGPLTSLVLGGAFLGAGLGLRAGLGWGMAAALLAWLGSANLLLGVFNLLPAAPLDGGRVLQALLWRRSGDRARAEQVADQSGQVVGYVLIGLGVLSVLGGSSGGFWIALIGFFVAVSAGAERRRAALGGALHGLRVSDAMSAPVETGPDWLTAARFVDEVVARGHHSALPLVDVDGRPTGLVTLRRIAALPPAQRATTRVRDVALPLARCTTAAPGEPLTEALERAAEHGGSRLLVVDGGRLVGIVTGHDMARIVQRRALVGPADRADLSGRDSRVDPGDQAGRAGQAA